MGWWLTYTKWNEPSGDFSISLRIMVTGGFSGRVAGAATATATNTLNTINWIIDKFVINKTAFDFGRRKNMQILTDFILYAQTMARFNVKLISSVWLNLLFILNSHIVCGDLISFEQLRIQRWVYVFVCVWVTTRFIFSFPRTHHVKSVNESERRKYQKSIKQVSSDITSVAIMLSHRERKKKGRRAPETGLRSIFCFSFRVFFYLGEINHDEENLRFNFTTRWIDRLCGEF